MITYTQLGKNGRLGNQMFQYAALYSVGLTRGHSIGIPLGTRLSEVFELSSENIESDYKPQFLFKERDFSFDPNVFLAPDKCDLTGYFQSGNYFISCKDAILKEFKFKKSYVEKAENFLSALTQKNLCTVHFRRGDYKNLPRYHTNLGQDYYVSAKKVIENSIKDPHFLIFSDEPEWCRESLTGHNMTIVDLKDDATEMCIMSKCKMHIIANSSYSWWGAYLSNSPAVVAPKQWFGPEGPKSWDSVYENEWVRV